MDRAETVLTSAATGRHANVLRVTFGTMICILVAFGEF